VTRRVVGPVLTSIFALTVATACGRSDADRPRADAPPGGTPTTLSSTTASTGNGFIAIPPDSPRARQIAVQTVQARPVVVDEVVAPGRVAVDPHRAAKLLLPVPGRIVAVSVRLGDSVSRGEPVVTLESPEADGALAADRQAAAAERQAQAGLTKAGADLGRLRDLYEHGAVAKKEVLAAENDLAQADAALETARAARAQAAWKLELLGLTPDARRQHVQVRAPTRGKIVEVTAAPGEYHSDTATPLMTIADLSRVWVTSHVPESRVRDIRVGDPVVITLVAYPDETFSGRVARIADVLDPETRTLKVHVELPNPDGRLRPDMFATVRHSGKDRTLPVVPADAVVQQYGRSFVFRERQPGQFERREVTVGPRANDSVALLAGIEPGERVVVAGAVLLAAE
jgi:cobalt-zinc-cadmium efflux system membrane fusion protein